MLIRLAPPSGVVISLNDMKLRLRVTADDDDAMITSLIASETRRFEDFSGRIMVPTDLMATFDGWQEPLVLGTEPLRDIAAVKYLDDAHAEQTLDVAEWYQADGDYGPEIRFTDGFSSPTLSDRPNPVRVLFSAGYDVTFASESSLTLAEVDRTAIVLMVQRAYDAGEYLTITDMRAMFGARRNIR